MFGALQSHWSRHFHGDLAGFSDSMIISPTCSGVQSFNSINKAKTETEVVSLTDLSLFFLFSSLRKRVCTFQPIEDVSKPMIFKDSGRMFPKNQQITRIILWDFDKKSNH